jgi:hypothetical protein
MQRRASRIPLASSSSPDGRVSRYLMGVRFDPAELRTAIEDARDGQIGNLSARLALACAHLDLRTSVHSEAVLVGMRIAGLATLALLAALVWRSTAASTVRRCRGPPARRPRSQATCGSLWRNLSSVIG